ncbi:MAG: DUF92 domain-containing protein [Vulcanisaeta sp.]|nr:DUF92 domain-containing protein [Vulcanisaeta sp.]
MHGLMLIMNSIAWYVVIAAASLVLAIFLAYIAMRVRVITKDALAPSAVVGFMMLMGGPLSIIPFITFLGSSSILTRLGRERKEELGTAEDIRGRNWRQVLAVGLTPATLAFLASIAYIINNMTLYQLLINASIAGIAYSNADTWASELGVLSKSKPRLLIKPWIKVDAGVSGGVTLLGEVSSLLGSSVIALTYLGTQYLLRYVEYVSIVNPPTAIVVFILGYLGEVMDSVLGAVLQPKYVCPKCNVMTDKRVHLCGERTVRVMGSYDLENEDVNLLVSVIVVIIALALGLLTIPR